MILRNAFTKNCKLSADFPKEGLLMEENRIRELRLEKGWSGEELAKKVGLSKGYVYNLEKSTKRLNYETIYKFANIFNVSVDYLLKREDRKEIFPNAIDIDYNNIIMLPIIGNIATGLPITAVQEEDDFLPFYAHRISKQEANDYFCLRIKGDSMEPNIMHGDLVIVKRQTVVDDGQIAIVLYDNVDATCKRITYAGDKIILNSDNTKYKPMVFNTLDCQIVGKVQCHYRRDY